MTSGYLEPVIFTMYSSIGDFFASGHVEEIVDTLKSKTVWKKGIIKTIDFLIEEEKKYHPIEVGGPIDLIKITKTKTKWLRRKSMCEL